jgi:hypothetical protein
MVETRVPVPVAVKEGYLHVGVLLCHLLGALVASKFLSSVSPDLSCPHVINMQRECPLRNSAPCKECWEGGHGGMNGI